LLPTRIRGFKSESNITNITRTESLQAVHKVCINVHGSRVFFTPVFYPQMVEMYSCTCTQIWHTYFMDTSCSHFYSTVHIFISTSYLKGPYTCYISVHIWKSGFKSRCFFQIQCIVVSLDRHLHPQTE
jgi:hypothetical protein